MSAEIIPLTKAISEYYAREREPRFRPVNEYAEHCGSCGKSPTHHKASVGVFGTLYLCRDCRTDIAEQAEAQREARELTSDNIRLTTIRPWRPEDDDGGNAA